MKKIAIFSTILFFFMLSTSFAAIRHVGSGQTYSTVGAAITASSGGDTIVVHPGTYNEYNLKPKSGTSNSVRTIIIGSKRYDAITYASDAKPIIDAYAGVIAAVPGTSRYDTQTTAFQISGVNNITLDGLDLRGGGGHESGTVCIAKSDYGGAANNITVQYCKISETNVGGTYASYNPAHIRISYESNADNILIANNEITGSYASGVKNDSRSTTNVTIEHNYIHEVIHGVAVKWGTSNTDVHLTIRYNIIRNCVTGTNPRGIMMEQDYTLIHDNVIDTCGWSGIAIGEVSDNPSHNFNVTVRHNTIYAGGDYAIYIKASSNTFTYNIFYNPNNVYVSGGSNNSYATNFTTNPLFTNASAHDFTLQAGSGAKGTADGGSDYGANITLVGIQGETGDTTAPTVTAFTIPETYSSLTVPITTFTATDGVGVTGYCVNESASSPSAGTCSGSGWAGTAQPSFSFTSSGTKTLYAWAKDVAGNISSSLSDSVVITIGDTTAPTMTGFVITPTSYNSRTVPIATLTATDAVGVTGYCLKESASAPNSSTCGGAGSWSSWQAPPLATYVFASDGSKTLYAWAKDAAGNISTSLNDSLLIDSVAPAMSGGYPSANQNCTPHRNPITFGMATDESSTCKYSTLNVSYDSMSLFLDGTGLTHTKSITPTCSLTHQYYVQCVDTVGNKTSSALPISFYVTPQFWRRGHDVEIR